MITLKDFLEAIDYRITEGSDYGWRCYGENARYLDCQGPVLNEDYSISCVFDSKDQTIYQVEAWDYRNDREYRWINPMFVPSHMDSCIEHNVDVYESFDGRSFIELDVAADILEKVRAIVANKPYDTRVQVPVNFTDEELLTYMKMAHDRDITFNQLVEEALRQEIGRLQKEEV